MGGCGGKKQREKAKGKIAATIGGQYSSTGNLTDQQNNLALVTKLMGEIGQDGEKYAHPEDRIFLQDTRIKMNQFGSGATFGWRQVEAMVRVHKEVMDARAKYSAKP